MPENKTANALAIIFVILFVAFVIVQVYLLLATSGIGLVGKIITIGVAAFFLIVIVFLIIERRKEPPIKY